VSAQRVQKAQRFRSAAWARASGSTAGLPKPRAAPPSDVRDCRGVPSADACDGRGGSGGRGDAEAPAPTPPEARPASIISRVITGASSSSLPPPPPAASNSEEEEEESARRRRSRRVLGSSNGGAGPGPPSPSLMARARGSDRWRSERVWRKTVPAKVKRSRPSSPALPRAAGDA
jgi:hypothetical protein